MIVYQTTAKTLKRQVYDRIAVQDDVYKLELMKDIDITSSSLNRTLDELLHEGWIVESGLGPSTGGRRPTLYRINAGHRYIFGLDISRIYSVLGLYDLRMNALYTHRWQMDEQMEPEVLADYVAARIQEALAERHLSRQRIMGIGIGAVGPLDHEQGTILNPAYFPAAGWQNVNICRMLSERTGLTAVLDNGANTALIGEHWAMRESNIQHMLYVNAGAGIRSAILSSGQLVRGAMDKEGAVGQMVVQAGGARLQEQGNYGALEAYVSIQALEQQVRQRSRMGMEFTRDGQPLQPEQIHFDTLVDALRSGNPVLRELFNQSAGYMGIGLANLINTLQPEKVILGGALINADQGYYDTAIAVAKKQIYGEERLQPVFSRGVLQENAVSVGAAVMILAQMEM
ncbi:ROK family protein [Paenibacillus bovis]|uniref:Sugar kinase n=1 Tax=Paenibacillus bovis TaxID=1616788 RepID=A0A172ZCY4_9BACL|nr:ROK family protein [Paenibacillus bovis]ANF95478.1 sugar kinase [Paenibacillus bovis]